MLSHGKWIAAAYKKRRGETYSVSIYHCSQLDLLPLFLQQIVMNLPCCWILVFCSLYIAPSEQGYAFPPDSFWVGNTPVLQFLLKCGLVKQKIQGISTDDIYTKSDITEGIKQLQTILGLEKTGKETPDVQQIVKKNKCPYNTRRNKPTFKHVQATLARFLKSPISYLNKLLNKNNLK